MSHALAPPVAAKGIDAAHGLRRWHALMEIVHTEVGYVRDLRVLVNVYLVQLPLLPLSAPALQAVQELTQEASELMVMHERFLLALESATSQVACGTSRTGSVDEAVRQVARLFIDQASAFDLYQHFCALQPDTLRLLRPVQARAEWATFERRCAAGGGDETADSDSSLPSKASQTMDNGEAANCESRASSHSAPASTIAPTPPTRLPSCRAGPSRTLSLMPSAFKAYTCSSPASQAADFPVKKRRHSYDSLVAVFGASSPGNVRSRPGAATPSSDGSTSTTCSSTPHSKLRFHDFLIKPVQRICKYPLMLDALRSKTHGESVDATVARAVEGMRAVTFRVDEARRRKEAAVRSKLIVDRIEPHAIVETEFIKSLGDCLLAGSLDVVHHHHVLDPVTTPVRLKYLGAFLYLGGYLLLVKVDKSKVYRIKHWFSLAPFEVVDIPQEIALVPSSFRLSHMDHHFEIAAACQREKDLWMRAINEARCAHPTWTYEPVSSLQIVHSDRLATGWAAEHNALNVTELSGNLTRRSSSSAVVMDQSTPLAVLRLSTTRGRLSNSNSTVRMFSLADGSSIILRRSSATNRILVDRGLVDVLSDLVTSLRKQAQVREEQLFPPPHSSDTSQTISIAAKNRLMRRGSMLVARPRSLLITGTSTGESEEDVARQSLSSTIRRQQPPTPRPRTPHTDPGCSEYQNPRLLHPELQTSQTCPSSEKLYSPSGVKSLPPSPTIGSRRQLLQIGSDGDNSRNHRRARSLVGSVRDLVRRATAKRTAAAQQATEVPKVRQPPDDNSSDTGNFIKAASCSTSCRRRVLSAPTTPPMSTAAHVSLLNANVRSQSTIIDTPNSRTHHHHPTTSSPPVALKSTTEKARASTPSNPDHVLASRRNFKNFIFYNRLTTVDSA